jgi:hypothetical protein
VEIPELVVALTDAVGSTMVSPSLTPLVICVKEVPTIPRVTTTVFCTPLLRTFTVETLPVVVIAALGSKRTFDADCTTTAASAVMPSLSDFGACSRAMVTGYSTTLSTTVDTCDTAVTTPLTSVSGRAASVTDAVWCTSIFIALASATSATSWNEPRLWIVTSAELDEELDVELDEELDVELELDVVEPPPLTVSPTEPFTAVTVPLMSATSWVSWSDFSSCSTDVSSWAMDP